MQGSRRVQCDPGETRRAVADVKPYSTYEQITDYIIENDSYVTECPSRTQQ